MYKMIRRSLQISCWLLGLSLTANCTCFGELRTWKSADGKYSVEAEFVELKGNVVVLKTDAGKVIKVPLEKLATADQREARKSADKEKKPESSDNAKEDKRAKKDKDKAAEGQLPKKYLEYSEKVRVERIAALKEDLRKRGKSMTEAERVAAAQNLEVLLDKNVPYYAPMKVPDDISEVDPKKVSPKTIGTIDHEEFFGMDSKSMVVREVAVANSQEALSPAELYKRGAPIANQQFYYVIKGEKFKIGKKYSPQGVYRIVGGKPIIAQSAYGAPVKKTAIVMERVD